MYLDSIVGHHRHISNTNAGSTVMLSYKIPLFCFLNVKAALFVSLKDKEIPQCNATCSVWKMLDIIVFFYTF